MRTALNSGVAMRRRLRSLAVVLVVLLALAVVVLGYLVNAAPAQFVSSSPGAGSVLGAAPRSVSLTFSRPLDPGNSHASVGTAAGQPITVGASTVDGKTIAQPVTITHGGAYLVVYHVAFDDGRELSGTLRFSVSEGDVIPVATAMPLAGGEKGTSGGHDHATFDPVTLTILGADAVVTVAVLAMLWLRRRRRKSLVDTQGF
jgi:methionine-rich copper-binding protein CopC